MATHDSVITLTTDYGTKDHYVAAVKGVIVTMAPQVRIVDITHDISPHNVVEAAFVLRQVWSWYPPETVHVVVVDPGVGTARKIIVGRYDGRHVVAPDNGLVTFVHRDLQVETMHIAENRRYFLSSLSATFHGRDVIAPVAAHLAGGVNPRAFGRACDQLALLPVAYRATATADGIAGSVLYVDRFGTLVTNIHGDQLLASPGLREAWTVFADGQAVGPVHATFGSVAVGEALALVGGGGLLEIAVNQGRAVDRFGRDVTVVARRRSVSVNSPAP